MHYMLCNLLPNELIDKDDDKIGPYLMLLCIFRVRCSHLGFGGHLGLLLVGL